MVACKPLPSQEYLRSIFIDEGNTVSWKVRKANGVPAGSKATSALHGYYSVNVDGRRLLVHRVLFKMRHGYDPQVIDHIDGNKLNNKPDNLRPCTHSQNMCNSGATRSPLGIRNVGIDKRSGKFTVRIRKDGKTHSGGDYDKLEDAAKAADELRRILHGAFAHGNVVEARNSIPDEPEYEEDTKLANAFSSYVDGSLGWRSFTSLAPSERAIFERAFKEGYRAALAGGPDAE